ncbi:N-acetylmuramoyl-L-alanine amidase [Lewinella sp. W8]|uniref:N-acetylmuramoyl-L-alanine amidase n=1 Tax=Lewinella sp. W8 TaxID=2528208 RepID=UPI001C12AF6F
MGGKSTLTGTNPLRKIVIDAGHGGKDPGGMGDNSQEKHIALSIAQRFAAGVRENFPDVEVIMTRDDDTFIPLYERAAIANRQGADLFVSIHANIMPGSKATYGTETFVMGQHVAEHNLAVAKRENAAILLEDNVEQNYGYDPNSDEGHIMMSMFQHAFLERSILFAELVEQQFATAGRKSRGVKQAGFVVLKETTMPSVLVETGFMSNLKEEAYLLSDAGQDKLAAALLDAFSAYYTIVNKMAPPSNPEVARKEVVATPVTTPPARSTPASVTRGPVAMQPVRVYDKVLVLEEGSTASAKGVAPPPPTVRSASRPTPTPVSYASNTSTTVQQQLPTAPVTRDVRRREVYMPTAPPPGTVLPGGVHPATYGTPVGQPLAPAPTITEADTLPNGRGGYKFNTVRTPDSEKVLDLRKVPDNQLLYCIQLLASDKKYSLEDPKWQRVPYGIRIVEEAPWYKYQIRGLGTASATKTAHDRVKQAGFTDSMVVVYYQGKRLGVAQVRYLLNR